MAVLLLVAPPVDPEARVVMAVCRGEGEPAVVARHLVEMSRSDVGVALVVLRSGDPKPFTDAIAKLEKERRDSPTLAIYLDLSVFPDLDLATAAGRSRVAGAAKRFRDGVPAAHRAEVDGRPLVWWAPVPEALRKDRASFEALKGSLRDALGGREPYIVAEDSWEGLTPDRTYAGGSGAAAPPERAAAVVRPGALREEGKTFERSWATAVRGAPKWVAIESWNGHPEGSGICECADHGKKYAEITKRFVKVFQQGDRVAMPKGKWTGAAKALFTLEYNPREQGLRPVKTEEGPFDVVDVAGASLLTTKDPGGGGRRQVAFDVDDSFCFYDPRAFQVVVEFLDRGEGSFGLEYDSSDAKLAPAERAVRPAGTKQFTGTGEWRRETFELPDALFANRQPGGADLRLTVEKRGIAVRLVAVVPR